MQFNWKGALFLILAVIIWHVSATFIFGNKALFPGPTNVMLALIEWTASGVLATDLIASTSRIFAGLAIGILLGIITGLIMGRTLFLEETAAPLLHMLRALPPIALVPLVILWLGIGEEAKIFTIASGVFFQIWLSTLIGVKNIPKDYLRTAKIFGKSKIDTYIKVVIPAIMPFLMNGIRIGIGIAYFVLFVSELSGASSGLGYQMAVAQITYRADMLIAALLVIGVVAYMTDFTFMMAYKRIVHWVAE